MAPSVFELNDDPGKVGQPAPEVPGIPPVTGDTLKVANEVGPAELALI